MINGHSSFIKGAPSDPKLADRLHYNQAVKRAWHGILSALSISAGAGAGAKMGAIAGPGPSAAGRLKSDGAAIAASAVAGARPSDAGSIGGNSASRCADGAGDPSDNRLLGTAHATTHQNHHQYTNLHACRSFSALGRQGLDLQP